MNTGDIYWVELPTANGHEQSGRRPALVMQDAKVGSRLPTVLVIPLSTVQATRRFRGTLEIKATAQNGLRQDSIALLFQLRTVDKKRIQEQLGTVTSEVMLAVFKTLDELMGARPAHSAAT